MAATNITFRMDEDLKKQAEVLFDQMGINMTTALNAFVKETVREGRIPFELKGDERAFWDGVDDKLREALLYAQQPDAQWHTKADTYARLDALTDSLKDA